MNIIFGISTSNNIIKNRAWNGTRTVSKNLLSMWFWVMVGVRLGRLVGIYMRSEWVCLNWALFYPLYDSGLGQLKFSRNFSVYRVMKRLVLQQNISSASFCVFTSTRPSRHPTQQYQTHLPPADTHLLRGGGVCVCVWGGQPLPHYPFNLRLTGVFS